MFTVAESDLSEIKPYPDAEVPAAMARALQGSILDRVRAAYFPSLSPEGFIQLATSIRSTAEFQKRIIAPAIDVALARCSRGLSISGLTAQPPAHRHVYLCNHRDIICDPALFTYGLVGQRWDSPLICLGDNLLVNSWVTDLLKMNRGVIVKRGLKSRELLRWSHVLSELIHRAVQGGEHSVWLAQREGRAKDGNDLTHPAIIKMLALAGSGDFLDRVAALRIVPVAISYEYDPCDVLKARELYLSTLQGGYQKKPGEDVESMLGGIMGFKGGIHIALGSEIRPAIEKARALGSKKDQLAAVVAEADRQIHENYRLWPSHYIALDRLEGTDAHASAYTPEEKEFFDQRLEKQLASVSLGDDEKAPVIRRVLESLRQSGAAQKKTSDYGA